MQKSLLDIAHPHPKYNFRPYWRDSYGMLPVLLSSLQRKVEVLRSENITSGTDEKGNHYVTFASEQVLVDFQKLNVEIRYLERLVRIRRFWHPRDWFQSIWNSIISVSDKIQRRIERRKSKRIANMTEEKRLAYYRKRIQTLEKKIISIYDKERGYDNDCSFVPASCLGDDHELKERLEPLLRERRFILDTIFQATPEEVKRLTEINNRLRQYIEYMKDQLTEYYRANAPFFKGRDLDEWIEASITAYPLLHESYPGDDFYGSNFNKILDIEYEFLSGDSMEACDQLRIYPDENPNYDADHLVIDGYERYTDFEDWKEYWDHVEAFRDIKFCYALHHMFDHQELPLVDILHKTSFCIDIKHEISLSKENIQSLSVH